MKDYNWNLEYPEFISYLKSLKEDRIIKYNKKLIFTKNEIIGIPTQELRKIAKNIAKGDYLSFLKNTTHKYYEEILIEGFVIGQIKEEKTFNRYFNKYINRIDNWSTCDMVISSLNLLKEKDNYYTYALSLLNENDEFVMRVGIVIIMYYYLTQERLDEIFRKIEKLNSEYYYANMATAWLLSVAYVKYPKETFSFLSNTKINDFIYNKTISKIKDSKRIPNRDKQKLKELKKKRSKK